MLEQNPADSVWVSKFLRKKCISGKQPISVNRQLELISPKFIVFRNKF